MAYPIQATVTVPASGAGTAVRIDEIRRPWLQLAGSGTGIDVRIEVSLDGTNWAEVWKATATGVFNLPGMSLYVRLRTVALTGTLSAAVNGWGVRNVAGFRSSRYRRGVKLVDFATQLTGVRASKEANQDPRQDWAFWDQTNVYFANNALALMSDGALLSLTGGSNFVTWSEDLSHWTALNSPTLTAAQLAPDGESDAYQVADSSNSAIAGVKLTTASFSGIDANVEFWVKKDQVESRFPEFTIARTSGSHSAAVQLDTKTGATNVRALTGYSTLCNAYAQDAGDWWHLVVELGASASGTVDVTIQPAAALTLGGTPDVTAQGSIVVWGIQLAGKTGLDSTSLATEVFNGRGYIETPAGASVARVVDNHSVASGTVPAAILTQPTVWTFWPSYDSDEPRYVHSIFGFPSQGLQIAIDGSNKAVLRLADSSNASVVDVSVTFSANQKLTVILAPNAGWMILSGFTTGNGTYYFTPFSFPSATALRIGNGGTGTFQAFDGVIAPPYLYVPPR